MPPAGFDCIHVYTSDEDGALAFVQVLAENLSQPVQVHPLSALATAPVPRPTRPQLRAERAALHPVLTSLNENIRLVEDFPERKYDYLDDLATLHQLRARYEQRLATIEQLLTAPAQKGGPADA